MARIPGKFVRAASKGKTTAKSVVKTQRTPTQLFPPVGGSARSGWKASSAHTARTSGQMTLPGFGPALHQKSTFKRATPRQGRNVSRMVAGGVVGAAAVGAFSNRSGRAADRPMGRPTGVYGF